MDSKFRDRKKKIAIDKINLIEFLDFYNKIFIYFGRREKNLK